MEMSFALSMACVTTSLPFFTASGREKPQARYVAMADERQHPVPCRLLELMRGDVKLCVVPSARKSVSVMREPSA